MTSSAPPPAAFQAPASISAPPPLPAASGQPAGFWIRVGAALIDTLILSVPNTLLAVAMMILIFRTALDGQSGVPLGPMLTIWAVMIGLPWMYFAGMESSTRQATLGKLALGIRVTDLAGERVSFGRATGRYFGKTLSAVLFFIGHILIAFTERKQGLHDMMASTLVLRK